MHAVECVSLKVNQNILLAFTQYQESKFSAQVETHYVKQAQHLSMQVEFIKDPTPSLAAFYFHLKSCLIREFQCVPFIHTHNSCLQTSWMTLSISPCKAS